MADTDRPLMVTILIVLYVLVGVVTLVGGIATLGPAGILAGIIPLIIAFGFYKGWSIMWYLGVIFAVIGVIGSLLSIMTIVSIIPLIINLVILFYLFKDNVKSYFLG